MYVDKSRKGSTLLRAPSLRALLVRVRPLRAPILRALLVRVWPAPRAARVAVGMYHYIFVT
jgi:hypothetical protein